MKKMRFFILLLGLVSLFGFTKVLKAEGSVYISITKMLNGEQQGTSDVKTGVVGDTLEYIPTIENATFMFWVVNGAVRADLPKDLTIRVTSKLELVAHFASSDKYSVAFLDTNTKLLRVNFVNTEGTLNIPSEQEQPSRKGTDFLGWAPMSNYDETVPSKTPENPGSKTYFVAKYEVTNETKETKHTVIINGDSSEHILNDVVTASTTEADFSYWMDQDSGAILSYSREFKFSVLDQDVNLVSVHDGEKTGPMVSIRRFFNFKTGYDSFIGHYELDESKYELIEVGFVHDADLANPHITRSINQQTNEFMLTTPDDTVKDNHYKMRAYMTYKVKATNEIITVKNQSEYQLDIKVATEHINDSTVYMVGDMNNWGNQDATGVLTSAIHLDYVISDFSHMGTHKIIAEPGEVEYKYVKALSADHYEVRTYNRTLTFGNERVITIEDDVSAWNEVYAINFSISRPADQPYYPGSIIVRGDYNEFAFEDSLVLAWNESTNVYEGVLNYKAPWGTNMKYKFHTGSADSDYFWEMYEGDRTYQLTADATPIIAVTHDEFNAVDTLVVRVYDRTTWDMIGKKVDFIIGYYGYEGEGAPDNNHVRGVDWDNLPTMERKEIEGYWEHVIPLRILKSDAKFGVKIAEKTKDWNNHEFKPFAPTKPHVKILETWVWSQHDTAPAP